MLSVCASSDSGVDDACFLAEYINEIAQAARPKFDLDDDAIDFFTDSPAKSNNSQSKSATDPSVVMSKLPKPLTPVSTTRLAKGRFPIECHSPATELLARLKHDIEVISSPKIVKQKTNIIWQSSSTNTSELQSPVINVSPVGNHVIPKVPNKIPPTRRIYKLAERLKNFFGQPTNSDELRRCISSVDVALAYPMRY